MAHLLRARVGPRRCTESALLVPCIEAEPVVATWRAQLDPAARLGVPAHVTVLSPFVIPSAVDDGLLERIARVLEPFHKFEFSLSDVRWFGDQVVYLAPDPAEPFREITEAIVEAFPRYRPYGGQFDEVIPHLTVCETAPLAQMKEAAHALERCLPISSTAEEVRLMVGSGASSSWSVAATFPLL